MVLLEPRRRGVVLAPSGKEVLDAFPIARACEELVEPWRSLGHDDTDEWEFEADHFTAAQTYAVFDEAVVRNTARIEAALAEGGLDLVAHVDDGNGNHPRLRRLLVDLLEEYARHTGHADLVREAVDGRVGEDPPEDWTPPWLP